jgi:hypothetical protein
MYTSSQAIADMLAASGPQEFNDLLRECKTQAIDNPTKDHVVSSLAQMVFEGKVFTDFTCYSNDSDDLDTNDGPGHVEATLSDEEIAHCMGVSLPHLEAIDWLDNARIVAEAAVRKYIQTQAMIRVDAFGEKS